MPEGIELNIKAETSQAVEKLEEFFDGLKEGFAGLAGLSELVEGIGPAIAAAFAVDKVSEWIKEIGEAVHHTVEVETTMGKLAQKTGLSVEMLSVLGNAAAEAGVPMENFALSIGMFADRVGMAYREGGQLLQVFRDLKAPITDDQGRLLPMQKILEEVVAAFGRMPDGATKAAAATELLGRSGRELIPTLDAVARSFEEMRRKAADQGTLITPEQSEAALHFEESINGLKQKLDGLWKQFADNVLPTLQQFVDWLNTTVLAQSNVSVAVQFLTRSFRVVAEGILFTKAEITSLAGVMLQISSVNIGTLIDAFQTFMRVLGDVQKALSAVGESVNALANPLRHLASALVDTTNRNFKGAALEAAKALGGIGLTAVYVGSKISSSMNDAGKAVDGFASRTQERFAKAAENSIAVTKQRWADFFKTFAPIHKPPTDQAKEPEKKKEGEEVSGEAATQSNEAKRLIEEIDKKYAESTQGRIALLNIEEAALKKKCDEEILDVTLREQEKTKISQIYAAQRAEIERKEAQEKAAIQMEALKSQATDVEKNPDTTQAERNRELTAIYQQQLTVLLQLRRAAEEAPQSTPEEKLAAEKEIAAAQDQILEKERELKELAAVNNPFEMMRQSINKLVDDWKTAAQQMASVITGTLNTAINSFSSNIEKGIMGTERWSKVWTNIAVSIEGELIQAVIKMFAQIVLGMILQSTVGKALAAAGAAFIAPIAAAQSAIWSAPATLSTIASYGAAADAAPGEIATAISATAITSTFGAAAEGGLIDGPGTSTSDSIPMMLSKGEFVFSAAAVQAIGAERLAELHDIARGAQQLPGSVLGGLNTPITSDPDVASKLPGLAGAGGASPNVTVQGHTAHIALLHNKDQMREWLASSDGEKQVVDIVTRKKTQIGIPS